MRFCGVLLCLLAISSLYSQHIFFRYDTVYVDTQGAVYSIDLVNYVYNASDAGLSLTWRIISVDVPSGWDIGVCDCYYCYDGREASGTVNIPAGDSCLLMVTFNPVVASEGTGEVVIEVMGAGADNSERARAWYVLSYNGVAFSYKEVKSALFNAKVMVGNQSISVLNSSSVPVKVMVFDILGNRVAGAELKPGMERVIIRNLHSGSIYWVVISTDSGLRRVLKVSVP